MYDRSDFTSQPGMEVVAALVLRVSTTSGHKPAALFVFFRCVFPALDVTHP